MRRLLLFALISVLPHVAQAQAYRADNRLIVVPLNAVDFEVIEARGEGARGIWCAAGSYAIHYLGLDRGRIYIKEPRGPSVSGRGRIGVTFTADVDSLSVPPTQSYSLSLRQPGLGLPIQHAYQFCKDYFIDLEDRF